MYGKEMLRRKKDRRYDEKQRAVLIAKKKALDNEAKKMRALKLLSSIGGTPQKSQMIEGFNNLAIENATEKAIENKEEEEDDYDDYDDDDDAPFCN